MGMFDSMIDADGVEWQTKAFDCDLDRYAIGDTISLDTRFQTWPDSFQVEVIGSVPGTALATIRDGVLEAVPVDRDETLPLVDYRGTIQTEPPC